MRSSVLKSNGGKGSAHKSWEPLKWIEKIIIQRDEGTMGFHDYVTVKEDFNKFVDRVTEACETVNGKFLGVSYPNEDTAVILYRWSDGLH